MIARRFALRVFVSLCVLVGVLAGGVGSAGAVVSQFGSQGGGAGQFNEALGIAVDQASGDVYLVDRKNQRVDEFTGEGAFLMAWGWGVADGVTEAFQSCTTTCHRGFSGAGAGEFSSPEGVAVDNDPLSASYGDVYVEDPSNNRVEKFSSSGGFLSMFGGAVNEDGGNVCFAGEKCRAGKEGAGNGEFLKMEGAIAVDGAGNVFVGDYERVQEFSSEGVYVTQLALPGGDFVSRVEVDGAGDLYVISGPRGKSSEARLRKYEPSGALLQTLDGEGDPRSVALDLSGDVYVDDRTEVNGFHRMLQYNSSGEQLASFDARVEATGDGLALNENIGELYMIKREPEAVRLVGVASPGPEVLEGSESVSGVEPLSVMLNATVNPEGQAASYRFEYGPTSSYGSSVPAPEGTLPANFNNEPVTVTLTKLFAGATYHYRVVASDSKGHVATGVDQTFTTRPAVSIDSLSVIDVAATSATFGAQLNPLGADATYRIEYDTSQYAPGGPSHGIGALEGSLGAGSSDVSVSAHVDGLQAGTLYHYRVVAQDTREGIHYTLDSEDQTFTTQAAGGGLVLPDGRRWEMVSPPDKRGAQIYAIGQYSGEGAVMQASAAGDAMTFVTDAPTESEPAGYSNLLQVLSTRSPGGWAPRDMAVPHAVATGVSVGAGEEYRFFSEDLSLGIVQPFGIFVASMSSEASEQTPYLHTNFSTGEVGSLCLTSCYRPLVTGAPGHANVPPGTVFGGETEHKCVSLFCGPEFVGATPDLSHVVLESNVALTSTPTGGTGGPRRIGALYEWSGGRLALISVLPGGEVVNNAKLGFDDVQAQHAISDDGSRIVWSDASVDKEHLYVRDMTLERTVQLDAVQGGSGEGVAQPIFQVASSDGSRVFFTDTQRLTGDSGAAEHKSDLYECEMVVEAGVLKCVLSDLTPLNSGESASVQGIVLGASENSSYVYFVADGAFAPGAVQGTCGEGLGLSASRMCNLYVRHGDVTSLVTVLSERDRQDWNTDRGLDHRTSRVSSDGRWVAFMSRRSLTGYDTRDAVSGKPDEEVYLYDASVGRVVCASCNPTGARPVGIEYEKLGDGIAGGDRVWESDDWLAANIPGGTMYSGSHDLYQSRYLSDSGRLFFNSSDALVPQDVNGTEDVYEFEPPSVGDCSTSSVTFSARSGGCVGLISSGGSSEESGFLDASATGGDVFFLTSAKLLGQDSDSALDVYDAHECTGSSPCIAVPVAQPPVCDTGDACKAAPTPQPVIFGAPSSATFTGAGNVVLAGSKPVVRVRGLTRSQKLVRALHACRKQKRGKRRSVCERKARARYAVRRASGAIASGKGGR